MGIKDLLDQVDAADNGGRTSGETVKAHATWVFPKKAQGQCLALLREVQKDLGLSESKSIELLVKIAAYYPSAIKTLRAGMEARQECPLVPREEKPRGSRKAETPKAEPSQVSVEA